MTHPLEDENRRLREALEAIEKNDRKAFEMAAIARAALAAEPASGEATHGSPELDADAAKLAAMGADPGPTFESDLMLDTEREAATMICTDYSKSAFKAMYDAQYAPPPPPTQDEEETARMIAASLPTYNADIPDECYHFCDRAVTTIAAALRQRADEATRAEREAWLACQRTHPLTGHYIGWQISGPGGLNERAAAIRARITPKGEP